MRHIHHLVPLALMGASLSCAVPAAAAEMPRDAQGETLPVEQSADAPNAEKKRASSSGATTAGSMARHAWSFPP